MPTKHCWARKSTPDTMKESLLRLSARGWTEMNLCFPLNRQTLFHWWVQTHLWGTFQREKNNNLAIDSSFHPAFFVNVFSSFAKWWTRKADIVLFLPTRERVPDVCCLTVAFCKSTAITGNWEWTQPSNDLFLYKKLSFWNPQVIKRRVLESLMTKLGSPTNKWRSWEGGEKDETAK